MASDGTRRRAATEVGDTLYLPVSGEAIGHLVEVFRVMRHNPRAMATLEGVMVDGRPRRVVVYADVVDPGAAHRADRGPAARYPVVGVPKLGEDGG